MRPYFTRLKASAMDKYERNLKSLKHSNLELYETLQSLNTMERFEAFSATPENPKSINLLDHHNNIAFYDDPEVDLGLKLIQESQTIELPYLYCFGIGNGSFVQMLLKQQQLKHLIVFEFEPELLYTAFNLYDFSDDLRSRKLHILSPIGLTSHQLNHLFTNTGALTHVNRLVVIPESPYYLNVHHALFEETNTLVHNTVKNTLMKFGNNFDDSIKGMRQTLENIPRLLQSYPIQALYQAKPSKTAIIISTGPSLTKQLPLLKEVAAYATLISVDASLPILEKHGITPDLCISMERDEPTAKFFQQTSTAFKKGTLFLCASVQHPDVFEALHDQDVAIFLRRNQEFHYFGLDDYGYLGYGFSAANFAHDLAHFLGMDEAVLIGQDLAFGADYVTHAEGHIIDKNPSLEKEIASGKLYEIEGYGGDHMVWTNVYWNLFLDSFVESLNLYGESMLTINATQGGARIPGTQEQPFEAVVEKLKNAKKHKTPIKRYLSKPKNSANALKKYQKSLKELIYTSTLFSQKIQSLLHILETITTTTSRQNAQDKCGHFPATTLNHAYAMIKQLRAFMDSNKIISNFFMPFLMANSMKLEIACQDALQAHEQSDEIRMIHFIEANAVFFKNIYKDLEHMRLIFPKKIEI